MKGNSSRIPDLPIFPAHAQDARIFSLQSALTISMLQCSKELGLNAFEAALRDQPQRSLMIRISSYGLGLQY